MFSSQHAIWKYANAADKLDDWLPYAEDLVQKWATQSSDEVKFPGALEVYLASLLLEDDLLPASARVAFATLMLKVINEASARKLRIDCLGISPPKSGRKEDRMAKLFTFREVRLLIQKGMSASEAYAAVAEKRCKSPETIRRDYERMMKKHQEQKQAGKNEK